MNISCPVRTVAVRALFAASVLALGAPPAWAALSISTGATANVSCASNICTATAKSAVLNVGDLQGMLATGNVEVATGADAADLTIKSAVSWVSSNTLTLDAYHSIVIDKPVTSTGSGGLTILDNDGGTDGTLSFGLKGNVTFWSLSAPLTINGNAYTLIDNVATLASDIAANPGGNYALSKDYDASVDGAYANSPIGTMLTGIFDGLGHTISNVTIKNTQNAGNIGLFADIEHGASVGDLRISNLAIEVSQPRKSVNSANVGGLAGVNAGLLRNVIISGHVWGGTGGGTFRRPKGSIENVGGLVGVNNGSIQNSGVTADVSAGQFSYAGGLVGYHHAGTANTISGSYATGTVFAAGNFISSAGGLVGYFDGPGSITNSYATGNVALPFNDIAYAGGLVGWFFGTTISNSYATGSVNSAVEGGGLVGVNGGNIVNCHASGDVVGATGGSILGGLVGGSIGIVDSSFASGAVSATNSSTLGGLVGANYSYNNGPGLIVNSYATGDSSAVPGLANSIFDVGGLVGSNRTGEIQTSYSTGTATASTALSGTYVGGLLGYDQSPSGNISSSYWDKSTSGITTASQGAGNIADDPGITGRITAKLQSGLPAGFNPSIWGQNSAINGGLPYLLSNPPG